jgi:hypothetical protein
MGANKRTALQSALQSAIQSAIANPQFNQQSAIGIANLQSAIG